MSELFSEIRVSDPSTWSDLQVIAMDIDGTLTIDGRFSSTVVSALYGLRERGLKVCLVTGRPSGWVQGLASYLPVDAAIAENGGVIFMGAESAPLLRNAADGAYVSFDGRDARQPLADMFRELAGQRSDLRITEDNCYRLSDWTFHVRGLSSAELEKLRAQVEQRGLAFTWSTIHAHIMPRGQEKGRALEWLLETWGIASKPAVTTLTIGDSPNDASLFRPEAFPLSAGVANIVKYRDVMSHYPKIVSTQAEGNGFVEIVQTLLKLKSEFL